MRYEVRKVGFMGLGDIGLPMAKRVASQGYDVTVCGHIRREPVEEMKALGAKEAGTPGRLARLSDVVITVLRDDRDTAEVILGPGGLIEGAREGAGIIMMSTLSPDLCRKVARTAARKQIGVLDAPVTGARMRAATGGLSIMVGGDKDVLEKYHPLLSTMGTVYHCGQIGAGQVVKLANNMALMVNLLCAYQAVTWGMANGVDEELLVALMRTGTGTSWPVQNWEYVKSNIGKPAPGGLYMGIKDLDYALTIAHGLGQQCALAELCREQLAAGVPQLPTRSGVSDKVSSRGVAAKKSSRSTGRPRDVVRDVVPRKREP